MSDYKPSKAAARFAKWRLRAGVISEVREMPVWHADDDVDVGTLGIAYNELRNKALHLARMVEKDIEEHRQHLAGKVKGGPR